MRENTALASGIRHKPFLPALLSRQSWKPGSVAATRSIAIESFVCPESTRFSTYCHRAREGGGIMAGTDPRQVIVDYLSAPRIIMSDTSAEGMAGWRTQVSTGGMDARAETFRFVKERGIPRRQVHAVTFEAKSGRSVLFRCDHCVLPAHPGDRAEMLSERRTRYFLLTGSIGCWISLPGGRLSSTASRARPRAKRLSRLLAGRKSSM